MKNILLLLGCLILFTGCERGLDYISYDSKVYFPTSGILEIQPLLGESIYELTVYKSGINDGQTATVDLFVDEAAFTEYQATQRDAEHMPANMVSIEPLQVTFDKDEIEKSVFIHFKGIDEGFVGKHYILPLTLRSGQNGLLVEGKKTTLIKLIRYRNQYQGDFKGLGAFHLSDSEDGKEKIDYSIQTKTIAANIFELPSHVNNLNLWVEVNGTEITVKEAGGTNQFMVQDHGSRLTGSFNQTYQRFIGSFDLSFSYESGGKAYRADITYKFDL